MLGALNKVKRYPRDAAFRSQQGISYIRFVMDREGKVLSVRLERPSGVRPLPKPPEEVKGDTIEPVVPVKFFMA